MTTGKEIDDLSLITDLIQSARIDLSSEKAAGYLATVFTESGIELAQEVQLSSRDVTDFMIGKIRLELKIRGANNASVFRQLTPVDRIKSERLRLSYIDSSMNVHFKNEQGVLF